MMCYYLNVQFQGQRVKARDARRITAAGMKYMRRTALGQITKQIHKLQKS